MWIAGVLSCYVGAVVKEKKKALCKNRIRNRQKIVSMFGFWISGRLSFFFFFKHCNKVGITRVGRFPMEGKFIRNE